MKDITNNEHKLEWEFKKLTEDKRLCDLKIDEEWKKNKKLLKEIEEREVLLEKKQKEFVVLEKSLKKTD